MTYGQVRDAALKLLHQYSLGDEIISRTYNDQGDYLRRIPELVDDAMWIIASGPRRIHAAKCLSRVRSRDCGGMMCLALPEDLLDIAPGGVLVLEAGESRYESGYVRLNDRRILLPRTEGEVWLEYYRRPRSCRDDCGNAAEPCDGAELDNAPETHRAIAYYVAAHLVLQDDETVFLALMKEWRDLLRRMVGVPQPHRAVVRDVYGWGDWA